MLLGAPYNKNKYKVLLLGGGELGKELVIELQHLGVETYVLDNKKYCPAGQVAHYSYCIDMLNYDILKKNIEQINPHCIIPEIEAINIQVLLDLENNKNNNIKIYPNATTIDITMNRKKIRDLACKICKCNTTKYEFASSEEELLSFSKINSRICIAVSCKSISSDFLIDIKF